MPTDLLKKGDDDGDEDKHMSDGAIAGLVIGLILAVGLIIFFIMWYFRFRHYWTSHKHKKMLNHETESRVAGGAHNNPYMSDVANDGPVHSDAWGVGQSKQTNAFSESWWPSANNPMPSYVSQTTPYPMASAPWPDVAESRIDPVLTVPTHCAVQMRAADHTSSVPGARGHFNFEQAGDLSQTAQGAISGLYPQLRSSFTSGEEPTTTTTSSNGKQILGHGMSQRMRSKVRMAARVSQLNMFNLRSRRRTSTRIHESTRGRPKRRRCTRNSSVTIGGATVMGGSKFSMTPGEGYHNMNVISDSFFSVEFDELGSLDNDEFLCSLEKAVFPGLDGFHLSSLSGTQTHRSQHSSSNDIQFRNLGIASNVVYPMSDFHSLATADLSLGGVQEPANRWRPLPPELDNSSSSRSSQPISFRFPTPGPPVAGWAHQKAQFSTQAEPKLATANNASAPTRSPPRTMTASSGEPTVPIAPAIQPPPEISSSSDRTQSITPTQTLASLSAAIPRRRAQKRIKARQQSEPRVTGSRIVGNVSDAFEQIDTSSDEPATDCST